ncbi:HTH-type transcriptional regulator HdfR [Achromobacter aegrifaciens]|uniref:LysR family transcriptional regulator n=1 Tax=Achromobacter aegrifaciens TaxID=1287736 RepID=UPI00146986B6|nr:LysR family transcriptional regulator [Achromobacter aegrifaciens]CAB3813554.1 HTH-type transcriptional regulator HdfR [Achromobacter aegrifaciens]
MDSRQLKAFVAVFEERNITVAARRLHLSQPALSGTIKSLEDMLGTQLFTRQARGVAVTEDARILYPQARRILSQTDSMAQQFRHGSPGSRVEIGVEADIAGQDIAAFLRAAREVVPALFVSLLEGCQGDARLATEDERCEDELFLPLSVDPYVLAMPAGSGADAALPWIVCPNHPTHQRLLPYYGAGANTPAAHAGSLRLALALTAARAGMCVAPESLAGSQAGVEIRPLEGLEMARRVGLCYAVQSLDKSAVATLVERLGVYAFQGTHTA